MSTVTKSERVLAPGVEVVSEAVRKAVNKQCATSIPTFSLVWSVRHEGCGVQGFE